MHVNLASLKTLNPFFNYNLTIYVISAHCLCRAMLLWHWEVLPDFVACFKCFVMCNCIIVAFVHSFILMYSYIHWYVWCLLEIDFMSLLLLPPCPGSFGYGSSVLSPPPPALLAKSKGTAFSKSFLFRLYEKQRLLCECFESSAM